MRSLSSIKRALKWMRIYEKIYNVFGDDIIGKAEKSVQSLEWKAIHNAPKNGTSVMLFVPRALEYCDEEGTGISEFIAIGRYVKFRGGFFIDNCPLMQFPTYWMNLPEKPNDLT